MTASEELALAAALIREQHSPDCPDHQFWMEIAGLLDREWVRAKAVEEMYGPTVVAECTEHPLKVARAYLATQPEEAVTR